MVSLPTGLAADTIWPDMGWIEALASVPGAAGEDSEQMRTWEEVQAA